MVWRTEYSNDAVGTSANRDRVIAYNEDDVGTFALRNWLEKSTADS